MTDLAHPTSSSVRLTARPDRAPTAKVALIRPPIVVLVSSLGGGGPMPPVGLAYLAAAVRQVGHDIQVVDAIGEGLDAFHEFDTTVGRMRRIGLSPESIVDRLDPETTVVGLSNMFLNEWPVVKEIAELARERFPDALIVAGGENATAFWPWMFEQTTAIDCVVKGEGERTIAELVSRVAEGLPYHEMEGLVVRESPDGAGTVDNGLPVRMRNLSEIARPAWDLFPMDKYFEARSFFGVDRGRTMPMLATRGCPYKCSFCSSPNMWTTRYNVRDVDDLVDEIADYVDRYGISNVDFVDLTAMTKRQWTLDFCDALERRGLDITWQIPVGARSEKIDGEVLRRLSETGCRNITFAPETGSQHMLEVYDKRLDLDHLLEDVRLAYRLGMVVHLNTIVGHPAETWRDRWQNLTFMVRAAIAGAATLNAGMFHPYPGSRDFQELYDAGKITIDETLYYDGLLKVSSNKKSWNENITSRQLFVTQWVMLMVANGMCHVAHPKRLLHVFQFLFRGAEEQSFVEMSLRTRRSGALKVTKQVDIPATTGESAA